MVIFRRTKVADSKLVQVESGPSNPDHRVVGLAVLDAARDAANRWIFPELLDEDFQPWAGVTDIYLMGALEPTHAGRRHRNIAGRG